MKFEIIDEPKRLFYGVTHNVDMDNIQATNFAEIWNETMKLPHQEKYDPTRSSLGLEVYGPDAMTTKKFTYSALIPVNTTEALRLNLLTELPEGKYIRFQTTFEELQKGFIRKVYNYINENKIDVSMGFDYEEYPPSFDSNNPQSLVYVAFKYNKIEE